jgi:hypothetical protein
VAAQLSTDPSLTVTRTRGDLGELRVAVDGADVVTTNPFGYPTPASVVARVREHLTALG